MGSVQPESSRPSEITQLLLRARRGDETAFEQLVEEVYPELRRLARGQLRDRAPSTLSTTSLVHEAFLKVAPIDRRYNDREHFFATLARAMRQVVVDHARARLTAKRGGDATRVELKPSLAVVASQAERVVEIDRVLSELAEADGRLARVVECRFFAGLTEEETASVLDLSRATVQRDWAKARAWLRRRLDPDESTPDDAP